MLDEKLRQHENYLAADAREGRGIGTKGLNDAADYIAAQMQEIGLAPAFGNSYFQPFEMGWGVTLGPGNRLSLRRIVLDTSLGIMPIGFSSAGSVSGRWSLPATASPLPNTITTTSRASMPAAKSRSA